MLSEKVTGDVHKNKLSRGGRGGGGDLEKDDRTIYVASRLLIHRFTFELDVFLRKKLFVRRGDVTVGSLRKCRRRTRNRSGGGGGKVERPTCQTPTENLTTTNL